MWGYFDLTLGLEWEKYLVGAVEFFFLVFVGGGGAGDFKVTRRG